MISPMSRVEIICLQGVTSELVAFVQEQGVLHIQDVPSVVEGEPGFLNPLQPGGTARKDQARLERLEKSLAELAPMLTFKPNPREVTGAAAALRGIPHDNWEKVVREWNRTLRPLARSRVNLEDNVTILRQYAGMLSALAPQLDKSRFRLGSGARFILIPSGHRSKGRELNDQLQEKFGPGVRFVHERLSRSLTAGLVLYPEELDDEVDTALRDLGISPVDSPEAPVRGMSLDEASARLKELIAEQQKQLEETRHNLNRVSRKEAPRLLALKTVVADMLARHQVAADHMAGSQMISVMHGWIPEENLAAFRASLADRFGPKASLSLLPLDGVDPVEVPTKLKNNWFARPFELLLQLYPPPTYGSIDPSWWVGVSFVLFYGFIMADAVYGTLILLIAWQVRRRFGHVPVARQIAQLAAYMGTSTIIFGVIFGEYMGNLGMYLFGIQPIWMHRISGVIILLYISLVVGIVHVGTSILLGIREAWKHGHRGHFYEKCGMFSAFLGMLTAVFGVMGLIPGGTTPSVAAGIGLILLGIALMFVGLGKGAFIQTVELVSLATNVMSYSRLMALGMASTALADVGNQFFEQGGNPFVGAGIDLLFQVLNICMGLFSPTLHSLRLNYVESLPKFYEPQGYNFKPFRKELPW